MPAGPASISAGSHGRPCPMAPPPSSTTSKPSNNTVLSAACSACTAWRARKRRWLPEEVFVVGTDDLVLHRRLPQPLRVDAPHDGDGYAGGLAHHEFGGARDLVSHTDLGDLHLAAVGVVAAAQVDDGGHPGAADGDVGETAP